MPQEISKYDDVIDSRDVIARIEELEEARKPWVAGFNMPGYMPDNEPAVFESFEDACNYIADEMDCDAELIESADAEKTAAIEDAKARVMAAADKDPAEYGETVGSYHFWIARADNEGLEPEEYEELKTLRSLAAQASGYADDWEHGETLIRDSYFKDYAQELAEDIGAVNADATWPNNCIDWDQAARELRMDYTAVEFDDVTYWVR